MTHTVYQIVPKWPNNRQMTGSLLSDVFSQTEINVLRESYESVAERIRFLTMEPYESLTQLKQNFEFFFDETNWKLNHPILSNYFEWLNDAGLWFFVIYLLNYWPHRFLLDFFYTLEIMKQYLTGH